MATATLTRPPLDHLGERRTNQSNWWIAAGAISIALALYVWSSWILSGDATRTPTGVDPVPGHVKAAWAFQLGGVGIFIGFWAYAIRRTVRERRVPLVALMFFAWMVVVWMDPATNNYIRPQLLYNSYAVNFGSWAPHIPGWLSPNAHLLPELILAYVGIYGGQLLLSLVGLASMRWAKRRRPGLSTLGVVAVGFVVITLIDLILEPVLIRAQIYAYPGAVQSLSLWGGRWYQFPLYEAPLTAYLWAAFTVLLYFRDDRGRCFVERGIDEQRMSPVRSTILRALAVLGFLTVINFSYSAVYCWATMYGGPFPDGYKSYMMNGICGPGTDYECTSPDTPVPLPGSGPTRPGD